TSGDAGVHSLSVTLKTAGTQTITAVDKIGRATCREKRGITVNPAAASIFQIGGFPSPTTAGSAGNETITAKDAFSNIAVGYVGTVHLISSDAQAVLPANYTFTSGDAGVHSLSVTLKTAGTQTITAVD